MYCRTTKLVGSMVTALCLLISMSSLGVPRQGLILSLISRPDVQNNSLSEGDRIWDDSGRGNHGVVRGVPELVAGKQGHALRLRSGAFIEIPPSSDFDDLLALSVEGWFCPEDPSSASSLESNREQILVGRWDDPEKRSFFLYTKAEGVIEWGVGWRKDQYMILRDGGALPEGRWSHLVGTWSSQEGLLRLYCNGEVVKTEKTPRDVAMLNSDAPLFLGTHNNGPGVMENYEGLLSDIRIWNRALSPEEIKADYRRERRWHIEPMKQKVKTKPSFVDVSCEKQLFIDDWLIEKKEKVKLTVNRPRLTGEKSVFAEKPWELGEVHSFGDSVMEEDGLYKLYYPSCDKADRYWYCVATSTDGIRWEKPELGLVPFEGNPATNIIYPDKSCPPMPGFFGTCVFKDTNPHCPPEERYKMICGDAPTWVFVSADGLRFKPMFDQPSFRSSDTNNLCFFDDRIGKYVAYLRGYAPLRVVARCEFSDLSAFGKEKIVFSYDKEDQAKIDKSRFVAMDFYNSSAIRYPYAANAYFMFPSAYYHFPEPPVGKLTNDGIADIHFATSRDGIHWNRLDREPFIPLQEGQNGLY
ncbi:MAG: LamG domain-containing protein, partial [Armatimonadetes bacterium]|nr:LamG domain-containing protein [Armatimonadota bacterium]